MQISSYLDQKQKSVMDFSADIVNLRNWTMKIGKSVTTFSVYCMER